MLRDALQHTVEAAVAALVREGRLPAVVAEVPVEISDTKSPDHGDYACNLAMVAAKRAGMNPRALGEMLKEALLSNDGFPPLGEGQGWGSNILAAVEVAGPGFLNLRVRPEAIAAYVPRVLAQAETFGHVENPNSQRINVEFVSVNPNGPITIGSGRGAAFGSALCNVLQAAGNVVHREYYINDGVNSEQMKRFAEAVWHWVREEGRDPEQRAKFEAMRVAPAASMIWSRFERFFEYIGPNHSSENEEWFAERYASFDLVHPLTEEESANDEVRWFFGEYGRLVHDLQWQYQFVDLGYKGEYVKDIAHAVRRNPGFVRGNLSWYQEASQELMIERQRGDLEAFGVHFDTWFSEQSLHDRGVVADRIEGLKATGVADEEPYRTKLKLGKGGKVEETIREDQPNEDEDEGEEESSIVNPQSSTQNTLWLRSTKFGDDMDRVLRRRDGRLTYIASDVAYHEDKLSRPEGATKLITILGPDHHGYIGRLTAVMAALLRGPEDTPEANAKALDEAREKLEVVIYQLVRVLKDGKPAPMRKRNGNIYELRDLIDELGKSLNPDGTEDERRTTGRDVARFFYLMRSHDTTMDFDIDLATQQSDENPVFYAQYAHARICSVLRKAQESGIADNDATIHTSLLVHPRELALVKKILDLPWEVGRIAQDYGVHRLTTYAVELARAYHHFYDACRVIQPEQPELTRARLALCEAARVALRAVFALLGVSAPERLERREPA